MSRILSPFSRRKLLLAAGLSGAATFLPSLAGSRARAQAAPIKRLVIVMQQHGVVRDTWRMLRNNTDYGDWEYNLDDADPMSFSETLRPLHAHREKLLIVEGLSMASGLGDRAINNHNTGCLHMLTGARMIDDYTVGGPSVDQVIAQAVSRPDRIRSLELATGSPFMDGFVNAGPSQRVPYEMSPSAVFDRLFPRSMAPEDMEAPSERELIRRARGSVLDFVRQEYARVLPKLSSEDRAKLTMHHDIVRDLETRLASFANLTCDTPPALGSSGDQIARGKAMAELTAAAFACDLTRVVTIQAGQLDNAEFGAPAGDVHQDFAHEAGSNPVAAMHMTNYSRLHAEIFAHLLDSLDRYQDGEGTLLDNTAAVLLTELGTSTHDLDKIPAVIAGSCNGYFRTGRYVSYAQNVPNPHEFPSWGIEATRPIGPGHSHLLVSLMQAMGLDQNEIGMPRVTTRDGNNRTIDLTGPLARLT